MSEVKRYVPVVAMGGALPTVTACEDGWLIYAVDHERIVAELKFDVAGLRATINTKDSKLRAARYEHDTLRAEVERLRSVMHRVSEWVNTLPASTRSVTTICQAIDAALEASR